MNPFFAAEVVPLGKTDQGHLQGFGAFNVFSSWDVLCAVLVPKLGCSAVGVTQPQCSVVTLQSLWGAWFVSHLGLRMEKSMSSFSPTASSGSAVIWNTLPLPVSGTFYSFRLEWIIILLQFGLWGFTDCFTNNLWSITKMKSCFLIAVKT